MTALNAASLFLFNFFTSFLKIAPGAALPEQIDGLLIYIIGMIHDINNNVPNKVNHF